MTRATRAASAIAALALALLCAMQHEARGNPADVFGLGSRGAALAGAAVAVVDDSSAVYYNPAAIARSGDFKIDVGYQVGAPALALDGKPSNVDTTHGLTGGLVVPGRLLGVRFAFGVAAWLPDDRLNRSRALAYEQPRWVYYDNRTQRLLLAAVLSIRLARGLYLGGGVAFMARTQGTVELTGNVAVSDAQGESALVDAVDVSLFAVRYPHVGALWEATPWLTLGASYRGAFSLSLDQAFTIAGSVGDPGSAPIIPAGTFTAHTASADLFQPWQLTAGGALRVLPRLLVAFDVTFARWSDFVNPASTVSVSLDLGAAFNSLVHVPPARTFQPPGFHDILVPRLGVELRALERAHVALDLRAGYRYEPSPAPEQTGVSNYADCDKHFVSLGAGVSLSRITRVLPKPVALDAHVGLTALVPRKSRKDDPTDPVGDFVASGQVWEAGVTTRWSF